MISQLNGSYFEGARGKRLASMRAWENLHIDSLRRLTPPPTRDGLLINTQRAQKLVFIRPETVCRGEEEEEEEPFGRLWSWIRTWSPGGDAARCRQVMEVSGVKGEELDEKVQTMRLKRDASLFVWEKKKEVFPLILHCTTFKGTGSLLCLLHNWKQYLGENIDTFSII